MTDSVDSTDNNDGIAVTLAVDFEQGDLNTNNFVDIQHMSDAQIEALATFVDSVEAGNPLTGKNKPSWLDDNLDEIPYTETYQYERYWHYHCGPSYSDSKLKSLTYNLNINLNGITSSEVIHYTKDEDGKAITIVAFSPVHTPFPPSDHPDIDNPLFTEEE